MDLGADARHPNSWYDRVADNYWTSQAEANLLNIAEIRRSMLEKIVPSLPIADKLELTRSHLSVQGVLHNYSIHLGSAAVICEDKSRHICIVPKSRHDPKLVLNFDQDDILSLIISKALLLYKDDQISDLVILRQLDL